MLPSMIYFTPCGDEIDSNMSSDRAIFIKPCLSKPTLVSLNPAERKYLDFVLPIG